MQEPPSPTAGHYKMVGCTDSATNNSAKKKRKIILEKLKKTKQRATWCYEREEYVAKYVTRIQIEAEFAALISSHEENPNLI